MKLYIQRKLEDNHPRIATRITTVLPEDILSICRTRLLNSNNERFSSFGWNILGNVSKYLSGMPQHLSWTETFSRSYPKGIE